MNATMSPLTMADLEAVAAVPADRLMAADSLSRMTLLPTALNFHQIFAEAYPERAATRQADVAACLATWLHWRASGASHGLDLNAVAREHVEAHTA